MSIEKYFFQNLTFVTLVLISEQTLGQFFFSVQIRIQRPKISKKQ
jgi:hypothetical protein